MKAWTLREPWASLVVIGEKKWETRSRPNWKLVGTRVAIHAAKKFDKGLLDEDSGIFKNDFFNTALAKYDIDPDMFALGSVIGFVRVMSCDRVESIRGFLRSDQLAFGDWSDGRYCFRLVDPEMIEPVPAKGALCVWEWDMKGYYPGSDPLAGYRNLRVPAMGLEPSTSLLDLEYPHL
jgi:hypothetical protein